MVEVSVSILSIDEEKSIKEFYKLEESHVDYFHIDVMDGKFVPNNTTEVMMRYSEQLKQITNIPLDIHLMVEDVKNYVTAYTSVNPNIITFHYEAAKNREEVFSFIKMIKENNVRVGISIKPNTKIEEIYEFLPYVHMVLIMTVEPGVGGQKLIPDMLDKVVKLRHYAEEKKLDFDIEVDGGVKIDNITDVKNAGVDIAVVGTGITKTENYNETVRNLKN